MRYSILCAICFVISFSSTTTATITSSSSSCCSYCFSFMSSSLLSATLCIFCAYVSQQYVLPLSYFQAFTFSNGFNMGLPHVFTLNSDEVGIINGLYNFN